ncbi:hypothetical protein BDY24DRAFT_444394 [Mrakia frigida]|uniref:uncharacterized protein n=1 Tax=Mrakia frigida TaxID=29902 RepID=UPI003FCC01A8
MSQLPFYNYQSPYAPIYQPPYISSSNFQGPSYSYPPPILPQQDQDQAQLQPSSSSQRPLLPPPWPIQPALNLPKPNPSFWKYLKVQADTFATMFSRSRACTSVQLNALSRKIAQNFTDAVKGIPNPSGLTSSAADAATYELIVRTLHQLYTIGMDRTADEPRGGIYKRLRSQLLEEWFAWISEKNQHIDTLEAEVTVARGEWEGVRGWVDAQNLWARVGQDGGWIARELELRTGLEAKEADENDSETFVFLCSYSVFVVATTTRSPVHATRLPAQASLSPMRSLVLQSSVPSFVRRRVLLRSSSLERQYFPLGTPSSSSNLVPPSHQAGPRPLPVPNPQLYSSRKPVL